MSVTPGQAEELAKKAVAEYLQACGATDPDMVGNVLMKLLSVAGVHIAQAEGSTKAFERLYGTAWFVRINLPAEPVNSGSAHG